MMFWWWGVLSIYTSHSVTLLYLSFSCSPCYYCVPCSCVRPGIQCGLSVRGTFRVSQTAPAPCAPSHRLASCCGCLWGLLQPASNTQYQPVALNQNTLPYSLLVGLDNIVFFARCCSRTDNAWLTDFPECTTPRSHRRHLSLTKVHLKAPFRFSQHSQPYVSRHSPLTPPAASMLGGAAGNPHSSFGRFIAFL